MKRTTIWIDRPDEKALAVLCERYGCESPSHAIRFAVRLLAASPRITLPPLLRPEILGTPRKGAKK